MPEATANKALERSCRLYQRLLKFYPKAYREEYGAAMSQLFRDQYRDARAQGRVWSRISFWLRTLVDFLKTAVLEHLSNLTRRQSIMNLFRPQFRPLSVFLPVFAIVFLVAVLTSIAVAFLMPQRFFSAVTIALAPDQPEARLASAPAYDPYGLMAEVEAIQSHAVLSNVVAALNLCEVWGRKYNGGLPLTPSHAEAILRQNIDVRPMRNTMVIQIRAFSDTPSDVKGFLESLIGVYRQYHFEQWRQSDANVARTKVLLIQSPSPPLKLGPNKPFTIILGVMAGVLLGLIAGGMGAGFVAARKQNLDPTGSRTIPSAPAESRSFLREKAGIDLATWLIASLWISIAVPLTTLIVIVLFLSLFSTSLARLASAPADFTVSLLFSVAGTLISVSSFALLRGKTWARVYLALAAAALAVWSALAGSFLFPGLFKGIFIVLGFLSVYTLLPGLRPEKLLARAAERSHSS